MAVAMETERVRTWQRARPGAGGAVRLASSQRDSELDVLENTTSQNDQKKKPCQRRDHGNPKSNARLEQSWDTCGKASRTLSRLHIVVIPNCKLQH